MSTEAAADPASPASAILLIAHSNPQCRHDAGRILADRIEQIGRGRGRCFRRIDTPCLTPELAQDIAAAEISGVVFCETGAAPNCKPTIEMRLLNPPSDPSPVLDHPLTPEALLACTKRLFGKRPPAWAVTVPGGDRGDDRVQQKLDSVEHVLAHMIAVSIFGDQPDLR